MTIRAPFNWQEVKAAVALTTAYAGWETEAIDCRGIDVLKFSLAYVHTDATSYELLLYTYDGVAWVPARKSVSGVGALDEHQEATPASAASGAVSFYVGPDSSVKLAAKRTGGTGGTLAARVSGGR